MIVVVVYIRSIFYRKELILNDVETCTWLTTALKSSSSTLPCLRVVCFSNQIKKCGFFFASIKQPFRCAFYFSSFFPFEVSLQTHRICISGLLLIGNHDWMASFFISTRSSVNRCVLFTVDVYCLSNLRIFVGKSQESQVTLPPTGDPGNWTGNEILLCFNWITV
jgi:hypothetical protein